jgi:hypothetical protein
MSTEICPATLCGRPIDLFGERITEYCWIDLDSLVLKIAQVPQETLDHLLVPQPTLAPPNR